MEKKPQDLEYISMEERPQPRIRFVGVKMETAPVDILTVKVELEHHRTRIAVGESSGEVSIPEDRLRIAAAATLDGIHRATLVDANDLTLSNLQRVKVFETPAVAVSLTARIDGGSQHMVGFCVLEREVPERAAALAVLNGSNRFLGGVKIERRRFVWISDRHRY